MPSDINGTDNSWPPVWYLERAAKNNKVTTENLTEAAPISESSLPPLDSILTFQERYKNKTNTKPDEIEEDVETTTTTSQQEEPRTRVSTAALARLCLFQNVCNQEDAQEYFHQQLVSRTSTTTTARTTTKAPVKTRRPRKRNPLLVAQLRACMQDSKYCNTDTFNHQHKLAMEGIDQESTTSRHNDSER